jgi:leucyl/phenylalanyl-tRNA--protein transferase
MPRSVPLDPQTLLSAYAQGAFPMADRDGAIRWYTADPRGIFPLERFHVPRTLQQIVSQRRFDIRINFDFPATMRACMNARRDGTWINESLVAAYVRLHDMGYAHSVEAWLDGELAGGLYHKANASKVALVHLVARLRERGYDVLDTQASTPHLRQFGCVDVPAADYLKMLKHAVEKTCLFD